MCVRTRRSPRAMTCSRFGGHRLAHSDRSLNRPSNDPRRLIETDCRRDPRSRPARDPRVWAPSASREARSDSRPNSRMAWHIAGFSFRRSCQPLRPTIGRSDQSICSPTLAVRSAEVGVLSVPPQSLGQRRIEAGSRLNECPTLERVYDGFNIGSIGFRLGSFVCLI